MDTNHDGEVDFEEFINFITKSTASKWDNYVRQLLKGTRNEKLEDETSTEKAMTVLIQTFLQYASKEGNPLCLEIKEMKHLLKAEMPTLYKCFTAHHRRTAEIMKMLDTDGNGEVDFKEFMTFIAKFALAVDMAVIRTVASSGT